MENIQTVTYDTSTAIMLAAEARSTLANASDFVIDSQNMYDLASEELRRTKTLQKEVETRRVAITGPLNQGIRGINDLFRVPKDYLEQAETKWKRAMLAWTSEQERIAAEARIEAEAKARDERNRLLAIEREQQEAARKAQENAQAAFALKDHEAVQRALAEAEIAQQQAAIAAMTAQVVTAVPVIECPPKAAGISERITYSAEVTSLMDLVQAVASGTAPLDCLQPHIKFLGAQARAYKKAGQLYPGVMVVAERGLAARAL